ncbi:hypothetical protein [Paramagnetospirillum magnetotacticum]|uniref:hypothetical protein n=1 Tax=Paramagnetospirillum magnetotacticum TaxID=188 RepID=UPI001269F467|nr:hypothetical protein [Paramagnetospirillum magnetotacticum]
MIALFLAGCVAPVARGSADAPQAIVVVAPIKSSDGAYVSPIKADGTLAQWVAEGIGRVGEFKQYEDGKRVRDFLMPSGPSIIIGGYADKRAQERVVESFGGWDYIRKTSDISFNTLDDLREFISSFKERGVYQSARVAASWLYPEFSACGRKTSC